MLALLGEATHGWLCNRYQVSYTPSIETLSTALRKGKAGGRADWYAVSNPQEDPRLDLHSMWKRSAIGQTSIPASTVEPRGE
jgi:hypothetical protein